MVFSHLGFWSGNLFLIAPFPDLCLLVPFYTLSKCDSIILCGDLNSRIGKTNDVISGLDNIPQRSPIDQTTNQHGHTFIEFLNDSKFCFLNERLCSENDDFTSVSTRGKAVVDYICVPHECYKNCSNFRVISPESLVHRHNLQHLLGPRSKLPDHYFLTFDFSYSYYSIPSDNNTCKEMPENTQKPFIDRKYKLNRLPSNFMNSNICRPAFTELINRIELCRENQNNIDLVYDSFCDTLIREMNDSVPYFDCTKPVRKRQVLHTPGPEMYPGMCIYCFTLKKALLIICPVFIRASNFGTRSMKYEAK